MLSRISLLLACLVATGPALSQTAPPGTAQPTPMCGPGMLPSGVDLEGQIRSQNVGLTQLAVSQVSDFAGLWKVITDAFGVPPPSVVADPSVIKSLQVVWFVDPTAPTPVESADIYAFDAQNCYVVDIGIEAPMFKLITPFTDMPSLAPKP